MSIKTLQELCTVSVVENFDTNNAVICTYELGDKVCNDIFDRLSKANKINDSNINRLQLQGTELLNINEQYVKFSAKVCRWLVNIIMAGLVELDVGCKHFERRIAKLIVNKCEKKKKPATKRSISGEPKEPQTLTGTALQTLCIREHEHFTFNHLPSMLSTFAGTLKQLEIKCRSNYGRAEASQELINVIGTLNLDKLLMSNVTISTFTVTPSMQNLTSLKLNIRGMTDEHVLSFLEVAGHNIQHLCICRCRNITDATLHNIQRYCPNLVSLDVSHDIMLTKGGLEQSNATYTPSMRHLNTLKLENMDSLNDMYLLFFLEAAGHNLQHLRIRRCDYLTDTTLHNIQLYCPNMVSLDLSYNTKLTTAGLEQFFTTANLTKLQRLTLQITDAVTDAVVAKFAIVGQLFYVNLGKCDNITCQSLPVLASIQTLKYIDLHYSDSLGSKDVDDFITCNSLELCREYLKRQPFDWSC